MRTQNPAAIEHPAAPAQLSFSPDGSKIALGFKDEARVLVLSGTDLSTLYAPDMRSTKFATSRAVSWSGDGQSLYASGEGGEPGDVLRWDAGGRGKRTTLTAASNTIRQLIPVAGGVAFAAADPSFGTLTAGDAVTHTGAQQADFRGLLQNLLIFARWLSGSVCL